MLSRVKILCALEADGSLDQIAQRRLWVNPVNAHQRDSIMRFENFYEDIRKCESKFFDYYRMSIKTFDELLEQLRPRITKQNTMFRKTICAEERLTLTLRYLSTGHNFSALKREFFLGVSTIKSIIQEACQAIWTHLNHKEMPEPTTEMWLEKAHQFYLKTNFPNCVGAVDGKHIRCVTGTAATSNFSKYKKFSSVVLMAVVDTNLQFVTIDIGPYGKEEDSLIFKDCLLGHKLYYGNLNFPSPGFLPNASDFPQPYIVVADEAFRLSTYILKPYTDRKLDAKQNVFNHRLSRSRLSAEYAFSLLANKWKIFHTPILVAPEFVEEIVRACCILHNFVIKRENMCMEDAESHPFVDVSNFGSAPRGRGKEIREYFADYFMGVGAVPFQRISTS